MPLRSHKNSSWDKTLLKGIWALKARSSTVSLHLRNHLSRRDKPTYPRSKPVPCSVQSTQLRRRYQVRLHWRTTTTATIFTRIDIISWRTCGSERRSFCRKVAERRAKSSMSSNYSSCNRSKRVSNNSIKNPSPRPSTKRNLSSKVAVCCITSRRVMS